MAPAAWVIVNVRPAMVIVPLRGDVIGLAMTLHVTVAFPAPAPGEVTTMKPLLLTAVHPQAGTAAVSVTDPVVSAAGTDADGADSENPQEITVMTAVFESVEPDALVTRTQ